MVSTNQTSAAEAGPQHACYVADRSEAAALIGVSVDLLDRLAQRGEGPPQIRISERRVGFRVTDLNSWLSRRTEGSDNAPDAA